MLETLICINIFSLDLIMFVCQTVYNFADSFNEQKQYRFCRFDGACNLVETRGVSWDQLNYIQK